MGDPKRSRAKYARPKKLYSAIRIKEESELQRKYGLKSKREIWKAKTFIEKIRQMAKEYIIKSEDEQKEFIKRLSKLGLVSADATLDDVLALNEEALLKRRLQTLVFQLGLANSIKHARQLIVHKHIKIKDRVVSVPSYLVKVEEEPLIKKVE